MRVRPGTQADLAKFGAVVFAPPIAIRRPYYAAYHARGHLSYAELDLEETPTDR